MHKRGGEDEASVPRACRTAKASIWEKDDLIGIVTLFVTSPARLGPTTSSLRSIHVLPELAQISTLIN
jgi:hypothetical protein